jgi:hypothetical protein
VNRDELLGSTKKASESLDQIVQRVSMFGEDDKLPPMPLCVEHFSLVLQERREFFPFLVSSTAADPQGKRLQVRENGYLGFELRDCSSCRSLVNNGLLSFLDLRIGSIIKVVDILGRESRQGFEIAAFEVRSTLE